MYIILYPYTYLNSAQNRFFRKQYQNSLQELGHVTRLILTCRIQQWYPFFSTSFFFNELSTVTQPLTINFFSLIADLIFIREQIKTTSAAAFISSQLTDRSLNNVSILVFYSIPVFFIRYIIQQTCPKISLRSDLV